MLNLHVSWVTVGQKVKKVKGQGHLVYIAVGLRVPLGLFISLSATPQN